MWTHQAPHLIKIQWNLFGWLPSRYHFKSLQRQCLLFLLRDIFLVICANSEEDVCFFTKSSISKQLLSLCLLTEAELIITVPSFEVVTETIWPWRREATQASEEGTRACWFIMSNPGFLLLHYTYGGAGRYKLCSNYPYTWPDKERRRAFVQRCSYFSFASSMDDLLSSFFFSKDTLSLRISEKHKWESVCWLHKDHQDALDGWYTGS